MTTLRNRRAAKLAQVRIARREDITEDLWILWIEKPQGYTFKPGQYCTIGYDGIERAYSIASAPHEDELELFVELVPLPDGALTPRLWELGVGDQVTIRPRAKGIFTFKPEMPNQLLVSTVTGVVPYMSILRDYLHHGRGGHRLHVLQGVSYRDEFTYDHELEQLAGAHPDLVIFVPTVSRPDEDRNAGWSGETGRVNLIVEPYVDRLGLTPGDTLVYACGHPGMIEDVKQRMAPRGFEVEEERFWKQD